MVFAPALGQIQHRKRDGFGAQVKLATIVRQWSSPAATLAAGEV